MTALEEAVRLAMHREDLALAERCREWLDGLTYLPDWAIRLLMPGERPDSDDGGGVIAPVERVSLLVVWYVPDVTDPSRRVDLRNWITVPYSATREEFLAMVFVMIRKTEEHERLEKFRIAGQPVFRPHNELGEPLPDILDAQLPAIMAATVAALR